MIRNRKQIAVRWEITARDLSHRLVKGKVITHQITKRKGASEETPLRRFALLRFETLWYSGTDALKITHRMTSWC